MNSEPTKIRSLIFITAGLKGITLGGGIATCFQSMIEALSKDRSVRVSVLYAGHPYYAFGDRDYWSKTYLDKYGVHFITLDINGRNYGCKEMQRSEAIYRYLVSHQLGWDVAIFHDFMGLAYYSLLARENGLAFETKRIIVSGHGNHTLSNHFEGRVTEHWSEDAAIYMERESLRMAPEITTPSLFYSNWLVKNFASRKAVVIPNIIYPVSPDKVTEDLYKFRDMALPLIVFYGRMNRLKGIDVFISAIKNSSMRFNVLFCGNATKVDSIPSVEYVRAAMDRYPGEVGFSLNIQPADLFSFVNRNQGIVVFPTLGETSSCVVVEAVTYGTRFLASDIPAIKELLNPEYYKTYLFPVGDDLALSSRLNMQVVPPNDDVLRFNLKEIESRWVSYLKSPRPYKRLPFAATTRSLISVVVPTCDRPELLRYSLKSLIAQTYCNKEIIVVDDASSSATENKMIVEDLGCIYVRSSKKLYKGAACNLGASMARGQYVCFFDDDDIARLNMLNSYDKCLSIRPDLDVISCFASCFEHESYEVTGSIQSEYISLALGGEDDVNLRINFFGKGTFIVDKQKFFSIGGYDEDTGAIPMVDYRFYIKAAGSGLKISILPEALYFYRRNSVNSLFYSSSSESDLKQIALKLVEEAKIKFSNARALECAA